MWERLENIAFVGTGSTPDRSNSEYYGGTIPWVNSSLTQNDFICETPECITEKAIEETSCRIYPIGTLIVAMYGQGKTRGQVSELKIVAATNQACAAINVYESNINSYAKLFFKYNYTTIRKEAAGGAQPNLNLIKIKKIPIPLPPLSEQHRIVAKIEELMPLVEVYDKAQIGLDALNAKLPEVLKKSILQEAIQGRLVSQDASDEPASALLQRIKEEKQRLVKEGKLKKKDVVDSVIFKDDDNRYFEKIGKEVTCIDEDIPFEIPNGWVWCRIGQIAEFVNGLAFKPSEWENKGLPIIRIQNLTDNNRPYNYTTKIFEDKYKIRKDDLLFSWSATLDSFIWEGEDAWLNQHIFKVIPYKCIDKRFLYYSFKVLVYSFSNITHGLTMKHLTRGVFENHLFALPPLKEQKRIVAKIDEALAGIMSR